MLREPAGRAVLDRVFIFHFARQNEISWLQLDDDLLRRSLTWHGLLADLLCRPHVIPPLHRSKLAFGAHDRPAHPLRLSSRRFRPCSAFWPLGPAAITTIARGLGRVVPPAHHTDWLPVCTASNVRPAVSAQDKSSRAGSLRAQTTTPHSNTPVRSRSAWSPCLPFGMSHWPVRPCC